MDRHALAGVSQLSGWAAVLEEPSGAFVYLLRQPVQSLLAPQEQGRGWGHVVGDSQRAQHLHWVPAQQSLPPSLTEGQRGNRRVAVWRQIGLWGSSCILIDVFIPLQVLIHSLLSMFHPRPFIKSRFAPQGAVACIRASNDFYYDIVFRWGAIQKEAWKAWVVLFSLKPINSVYFTSLLTYIQNKLWILMVMSSLAGSHWFGFKISMQRLIQSTESTFVKDTLSLCANAAANSVGVSCWTEMILIHRTALTFRQLDILKYLFSTH